MEKTSSGGSINHPLGGSIRQIPITCMEKWGSSDHQIGQGRPSGHRGPVGPAMGESIGPNGVWGAMLRTGLLASLRTEQGRYERGSSPYY